MPRARNRKSAATVGSHPCLAPRIAEPRDPVRVPWLDLVRGVAVVWMTAYHFAFDLNHFGFIHQDFYRAPLWTIQRTCILSLFLFCAGFGQALAAHSGQSWRRFWRRWSQIALCALAVSIGSALMFPNSWIYFGVLHAMAVMLIVCRVSAGLGPWLWVMGALAVLLGLLAPHLHAAFAQAQVMDTKAFNWIGLISRKPVTEDYVPLLPWLGVMWWGLATGQWMLAKGWLNGPGFVDRAVRQVAPLAWVGRWNLSWYMLHQPILIGVLTLVVSLR